MNSRLLAVSSWLLAVSCYLFAADISAPKMEIVDTPDGRTTVFPQGITIIDKDNKITGKYAVFYEKENRAIISDSVKIVNPQLKIIADTAFYSFAEKKSNLTGKVQVESETLKIETPNLTFEQSRNFVKAQDGVKIREKLQNLTVIGKIAEYNFTDGLGTVDSSPTLYIERSDTTVIQSTKMILKNKESQFLALDSVTAKAGNTILTSDTLLFFIKDDSGIATGNPKIFDNKNIILGKTIKFYFGEDDSMGSSTDRTVLKTIKILESASANYVTSDSGRLEVEGNIFSINYKDGDIENIRVFGDSLNFVSGKFYPKEKL